ncbi:unnamed protein product [Discula destructiva]
MLEFLAYKKFKKNRDTKTQARDEARTAEVRAHADGPVLTDDDERFFERLTSEDGFSDVDGNRPPLPPRVKTPDYAWDSETDSYVGPRREDETDVVATGKGMVKDDGDEDLNGKGKGKGKEHEGAATTTSLKRGGTINRLNVWIRRPKNKSDTLEPTNAAIPIAEEEREKDDLSRVLDDLNLAARNNKTFSLSQDSQELVGKFTVVLKDLVNGVPTAATDLRHLLDDHDGTLARNYDKLPGSMKKMVTSLPSKLTGSLAPELLAVAAASQGLEHDRDAAAAAGAGGVKDQAMKLLMPKNLAELVTKPSAIVGMLKAIMNALKLRWPAFIGTNVIWSVALFLLMFVLWYCHKRGREVRLEKEKTDAADMEGRVEEVSDNDSGIASVSTPLGIGSRPPPPLLEGPGASSSRE